MTDTKKSDTVPAKIKREVEKTIQELGGPDDQNDKTAPGKAQKHEITFEHLKRAYYLNEYGDADITIKHFTDKIVRDNSSDSYYMFFDHIWQRCKNREQEAVFREIAEIYGREAINCKKRAEDAEKNGEEDKKKEEKQWQARLNSRANKLRSSARMRNTLNLATAGEGSLGIAGENWNLIPTLLPVANGVIDLETGRLRDGKPGDWFNMGSKTEYKGFHYGDAFVKNLVEKLLCFNESVIEHFEFFIGACLTGIQTKDFFVAYGPRGDNGKSVFFDWMSDILGGFAATVPVELIYEDRFGRDPDKPSPSILKLRGLRMAVMSEAQGNKRLSTAKVKQMTSGTDKMSARNLQEKDIIDFTQTHTTLMHSNEIPSVLGNSGPFYNRLVPFPFKAQFVKEDKDVDESNFIYKQIPRLELDRLLREYSSDMLSYMVRCAKKFLIRGDMPDPPEDILNEKKFIKQDNDIFGRFLEVCTEKNKDSQLQAKDIYKSFRYFCKEELGLSEKQIPSQKAISRDLAAQAHISRLPGRVIDYRGIKIIDEWVPPSNFD